jgi:hypothetical protein
MHHACFGIESANQEILDTVKKEDNLAKCESAIAMCQAAGITPMTPNIPWACRRDAAKFKTRSSSQSA